MPEGDISIYIIYKLITPDIQQSKCSSWHYIFQKTDIYEGAKCFFIMLYVFSIDRLFVLFT